MKRNLIFIFYSTLIKSGGGIESWIQKFLCYENELLKTYETINIIAIYSEDSNLISKSVLSDKIVFHYIKLNENNNLTKLLSFTCKSKTIIKKIVRQNTRNDLVSVGTLYPCLPLAFFIRKKNIKKIIWLRSTLLKQLSLLRIGRIKGLIKLMEGFFLTHSDLIIANGKDTKDFYENVFNLSKIIVIHNAINPNSIIENKNYFNNEKITIGYVGRLYNNKGICFFLDSIKQYNEVYPNNNLVFKIIGYGEEEHKVIEIVKLYSNVNFLGALDNDKVLLEISTFDASVQLTSSQNNGGGSGVSNSLLEAIFANNLIIAWDNQIYRQVLNNSMCLYVLEESIERLTESFVLLNNRNEMKQKIQNSNTIRNQYLMNEHVKTFIEHTNNLWN